MQSLFAALAIGVLAVLLPGASFAQQSSSVGTYVLRAGDEVNVQVFGEDKMSQTTRVLPDGTIGVPPIGRLYVAGMTTDEAGGAIAQRLRRYILRPIVTVTVTKADEPNVLVLGNVKTPGKYQLRPNARLIDAIAAAGGLGTTNGPYPDVRIASSKGETRIVSLEQLLRKGQLDDNVSVDDGTAVYVGGPTTFRVTVLGAVDHPGEIDVNEGDRLTLALARAGNSAGSRADLNHIRLQRMVGGSLQFQEINLYRTLEGGHLGSDVVLERGDVIFVPSSPNRSSSDATSLLGLLGRLFRF